MTALEKQFQVLALHRSSVSKGLPPSVGDPAVLEYLAKCVPFSWSTEATQAVWAASQSVPLNVVVGPDLMPEGVRAAWWWFETPVPVPMSNPGHDPELASSVRGLMIVDRGSELWMCDCRQSRGLAIVTGLVILPLGHTLQELLDGVAFDPETGERRDAHPRSNSLMRFLVAAAAWLRQRIVTMSNGHVERHRRKQLTREHDAPVAADVKIIELRRLEHVAVAVPGSGEPVDWSCRWIVNGHWRNQYHPSDGRHELCYILPHVKGPADKPLRVPAHTVYHVSR